MILTVLLALSSGSFQDAAKIEEGVVKQRQGIKTLKATFKVSQIDYATNDKLHLTKTIQVALSTDDIREEVVSANGAVHSIRILADGNYFFWPNKVDKNGQSMAPVIDLFKKNPRDYAIASPRILGFTTLTYLNLVHAAELSFIGNPQKETQAVDEKDGQLAVTYFLKQSETKEKVTYDLKHNRISKIVNSFVSGAESYETTMQASEWAAFGDIYFPKKIIIERKVNGKPTELYEIIASDLAINQPVGDSFSISSMGIPAGTSVSDMRPGNHGVKIWNGKELVDPLKENGNSSISMSTSGWYLALCVVFMCLALLLSSQLKASKKLGAC